MDNSNQQSSGNAHNPFAGMFSSGSGSNGANPGSQQTGQNFTMPNQAPVEPVNNAPVQMPAATVPTPQVDQPVAEAVTPVVQSETQAPVASAPTTPAPVAPVNQESSAPQGQNTDEDESPANFQLGTKLPAELKVPVPPHTLNFDEKEFMRLLASSISLSKAEKKRIIDSIPKLKQGQINELVRIFEDEKKKFAALSKKHLPQLEKLATQHYYDWLSIEDDYASQQRQAKESTEADEIRKKLGL